MANPHYTFAAAAALLLMLTAGAEASLRKHESVTTSPEPRISATCFNSKSVCFGTYVPKIERMTTSRFSFGRGTY
jgi:hypothetical protein